MQCENILYNYNKESKFSTIYFNFNSDIKNSSKFEKLTNLNSIFNLIFNLNKDIIEKIEIENINDNEINLIYYGKGIENIFKYYLYCNIIVEKNLNQYIYKINNLEKEPLKLDIKNYNKVSSGISEIIISKNENIINYFYNIQLSPDVKNILIQNMIIFYVKKINERIYNYFK